MKLLLALILVASLQGWSVEPVNDDEFIIVNGLGSSIICYVYYENGDFKKFRIRAHGESRPFRRRGLLDIECF